MTKRLPLSAFGHVKVGIHAGLEPWDAAQLAELRGVRLVSDRFRISTT